MFARGVNLEDVKWKNPMVDITANIKILMPTIIFSVIAEVETPFMLIAKKIKVIPTENILANKLPTPKTWAA